jgi:hypothetical protein
MCKLMKEMILCSEKTRDMIFLRDGVRGEYIVLPVPRFNAHALRAKKDFHSPAEGVSFQTSAVRGCSPWRWAGRDLRRWIA